MADPWFVTFSEIQKAEGNVMVHLVTNKVDVHYRDRQRVLYCIVSIELLDKLMEVEGKVTFVSCLCH